MKRIFLLLFLTLFWSESVYAHCPLCTAGAGAAAVLASWLGVGTISIGIFVGAFALALGLWIGRLIKKKYIPFQTTLISLFSFFTTVIPIKAVTEDYTSIYISLFGSYGTLFNRTYLIDKFLFGSVIGGILIILGEYVSKKITKIRKNKNFPFQGMIITFLLLLLVSLIFEFILW